MKNRKMNNQVFIPSNGIEKIYLDLLYLHWYYHESSTFSIDKEIPFLELLLDMASLHMRYYLNINRSRIGIPQIILDIRKHSAKLICSFIRIKALSEDIFCTADIATVDHCMEVYRQFINKEPFDFSIQSEWKIREAFHKLSRNYKFSLEIYINYLDYSMDYYLRTQNSEKILIVQNKCLKKV